MQVTLDDIGKQYGDHWIFRGISARFEKDHVYPIIGNNGSGKSTLMQLIAGYVTPNQGEVSFVLNGEDLAIEHWYQHLTIAAPSMELFEEFSVKEAVTLHHTLKPIHGLSPTELMAEVDLEQHAAKPLHNLSSGMRQRLKLALAIFSDSPLLLLDEPCSNLDKTWMKWYNDTLTTQRKGRIVVICSNEHSEELAQATDAPIDVSASRYH